MKKFNPPARPPVPRELQETHRAALARALREGACTSRDLSTLVGIREKDVAPHLEHLQRSAAHRGERLVIEAAACLACGFRFSQRQRLTTPGRCPECSSERIEPPVFSLIPASEGTTP